MKIQAVEANNRKKAFELRTARGAATYPYAKLSLPPTSGDRVAVRAFLLSAGSK